MTQTIIYFVGAQIALASIYAYVFWFFHRRLNMEVVDWRARHEARICNHEGCSDLKFPKWNYCAVHMEVGLEKPQHGAPM